MTMNRQMQNVIKNLGRNLDNMKVYSLLIFIAGAFSHITAAKVQKNFDARCPRSLKCSLRSQFRV